MNIDYNIVKTFIPKEDIEHFLVFVSIYVSGKSIIAPYRAPFEKKLIISISDYIARYRDIKIDQLIENSDLN